MCVCLYLYHCDLHVCICMYSSMLHRFGCGTLAQFEHKCKCIVLDI